jgi:hypothetical protein
MFPLCARISGIVIWWEPTFALPQAASNEVRDFWGSRVDTDPAVRLYKPLGTPSAFRRDGAPAKPSLIFGDQASDLDRKYKASTALRLAGGWDHTVPGCLTSESEERETWTAESLRAAILGDGFGFFHWGAARTRLRRSTFQVNTVVVKAASGSASNRVHACARHVQKWDLVKGNVKALPCET